MHLCNDLKAYWLVDFCSVGITGYSQSVTRFLARFNPLEVSSICHYSQMLHILVRHVLSFQNGFYAELLTPTNSCLTKIPVKYVINM